GCESNPKKRQRIDGEMEGVDESKSTDQGNRNGDRRNNRRTPIQQEEEDDNDDNDYRLFQRSNHFLYRVAHHRGRVEGDYILDAGRERLRKLDERRLGGFVDLQRIGIRELLHANTDGFVPTIQKVRVIALRADFRASDVLELHNSVAGILDDDIFEFPRLRESPDHSQCHLKSLLGIGGRAAQLSSRYFDVLLLQSSDHVSRSKLARSQLCWV